MSIPNIDTEYRPYPRSCRKRWPRNLVRGAARQLRFSYYLKIQFCLSPAPLRAALLSSAIRETREREPTRIQRKGVQTPQIPCPSRVKYERVDGFANDPPIFRTAIKHSCGPRAAQEFPELCAFVRPHANVSCNAIISDGAEWWFTRATAETWKYVSG